MVLVIRIDVHLQTPGISKMPDNEPLPRQCQNNMLVHLLSDITTPCAAGHLVLFFFFFKMDIHDLTENSLNTLFLMNLVPMRDWLWPLQPKKCLCHKRPHF
jgi:hypothetical protein